MRLTWKNAQPERRHVAVVRVADGEDYYFIYGPALDTVIAGYRHLTGQATLMPEWAFGLWQ